MIRLFVLVGIVGGLAIAYLATFAVGPEFQLAPKVTLLKGFQAAGVVPDANSVTENEEVEHGIFEVPPEDERQLEMAMKMGGMKMGGMKMPAEKDAAAPKMKLNPDGTMMTNADGSMVMEGDAMGPEGGLKITEEGAFDREINLTMAEWRFSDMNIEVKSGERIRFNIVNGGQIPHEFMFMTMPAMAAINYRARRADWSLLEHEALYEKSLVLPGGKFSFVVEVAEDGAWMFMCMLPYHMQLGMMGQMATPGNASSMNMKM